jgi:SAM-dependent methyltransferase
MDAGSWDERYRTAEFVWKTDPNRFLPPEVTGLQPGRALDLACGEGRNAVWLATQDWKVTGVDYSQVGLDKAAGLAESNHVTATWIRADVTQWQPDDLYDLVVVFYLQLPEAERRIAFGTAARALAPGGHLLVVGHDLTNLTEGTGGPQSPTVLYTPDSVCADLHASGVTALVIDRAERVERPVDTDAGTVAAIDCLVRAHRLSAQRDQPPQEP